MITTEEIIEISDKYTFNTYSRYKIVAARAQDGYIIDKNGKKYLDFTAGIAVNSLGYDDKGLKNALKAQIDKILHCSNLYYNEPQALLARELCSLGGLSAGLDGTTHFQRAFFCNSGAEANEGALKLVRLRAGKGRGNFISFKNSFHGRTTGALALTGQTKYQQGFEPLIGEVRFAEFNNFESVAAAIDNSVCAIFLEPIQGEGGVNPAERGFLEAIRKLCDEKNIALIFDEVQTGIGRTGKFFAYENFGVKPDIITLAKGLGGGVPIGAILARGEFAEVFKPTTHGTTFGGSPLACTAGLYITKKVAQPDFLANVRKMSEYFKSQLQSHSSGLKGQGLLLGLEVEGKPADYVRKALEKGLLILGAGENVLRFAPPLTITKAQIDEGIKILKEII